MEKYGIYVLVLIIAVLNECKSETNSKPNVIIIFNDDMGYSDLQCFGASSIKTPNVDKMASEGMRFTDFYVASSVCSASRASLLTGRYPQKVGVGGVFFPNTGRKGLNPKHYTIAEALKDVGYKTAAIGKWHLGDMPEFLPTNQGFDSYYGIPYSNDMYAAKGMKYAEKCEFLEGYSLAKIEDAYKGEMWGGQPKLLKNKVPLMRNEECIEYPCDQRTITRRYADESIEFIEKSVNSSSPFFLYLANSMPHIPLFRSSEFEGISQHGIYGDVIEEIDFNTGRILNHLKKLGIEENTIVIFTSDNGPWLEVGKDISGSAYPFFEGKFTSFEGGMRVPCIIKWPESIPAGTICTEMTSTIDILPTIANITGAQLQEKELDGKDVFNLWKNEEGATPHSFLFFVYQGEAVRSGDWKYHKKEIFRIGATARSSQGPSLYNLKQDTSESINVIKEYPEVARRLSSALDEHMNSYSK